MRYPGDHDLRLAAEALAMQVPARLAPLSRLAYNYLWSWLPDGPEVFQAIDPEAWARVAANPVRLLREVGADALRHAAGRPELIERIRRLEAAMNEVLGRPFDTSVATPEHPVAFLCAEHAVHSSLPIYSGGLGVLAGDFLKSSSDLHLPMVGVGLMYRTGYFHQRLDVHGQQHEYWLDTDPRSLPAVRVTDEDRHPITVSLPIDDEEVAVGVWRVDVGRVPLYLLDTDLPGNSVIGRWITSRLYEGNRRIRLGQYAVLGVGGARMLRAMGLDPVVYHLNEGHAALASFALSAEATDAGASPTEAWAQARERVVFTTHTPVPAGNERYGRDEIMSTLGRLADQFGDREQFLALGRIHPDDPAEDSGMTTLALRASRSANGVSRRHGEVARAMWQPVLGGASVDEVAITSVTNGVHLATWLQGPMRELLDRHLGPGWLERGDDPATWAPVDTIPDEELWAARQESRRQLIDLVTDRSVADRLRRGEDLTYAEAAQHGFQPDRLTIGFARRIATYKRLYLVIAEPARALGLLGGDHPVQFVFAGKAHPDDAKAKEIVRRVFGLKTSDRVAGSVAFLEDYDLRYASQMVAGCDLWVNLPRPPQEASGTSGMKAAVNGGLNLSVLDGWWAEAYDGTNGWAISGEIAEDDAAQDEQHARELFDRLEHEIIPMFNDRDADGVPHRWVAMVKRSLRTNGPAFSAARMVREYADRIYRRP